MFMFAIPVVFGIITVAVIIATLSKQAKESKKKSDAEKAMSLLDNKEEFKKFLEYDSSELASRPQNRPQQSTATQRPPQRPAQPQQQANRPQQSKQQMTAELQQRLAELKRRQAEREAGGSKNIVTTSHHDSHCDVSHKDNNDKYRVEYVPTMHSIGGKSTEGCEEHYHVRYVKLDDEDEKDLQLTPLQKTIVYGEVINRPAFKRQYRSNGYRG